MAPLPNPAEVLKRILERQPPGKHSVPEPTPLVQLVQPALTGRPEPPRQTRPAEYVSSIAAPCLTIGSKLVLMLSQPSNLYVAMQRRSDRSSNAARPAHGLTFVGPLLSTAHLRVCWAEHADHNCL